MIIPNDKYILKWLEEIREDCTKVLTNQFFSKDEWIQYNQKKHYFEYEDGVFLGYTPKGVILMYRQDYVSGYLEWLKKACWYIKLKS